MLFSRFMSLVSRLSGFICQEEPIELPCDPLSTWQFHALWHVMCAISLGTIYVLLRSEFIGFEGDDLSAFIPDEDTSCYYKAIAKISVSPPRKGVIHAEL